MDIVCVRNINEEFYQVAYGLKKKRRGYSPNNIYDLDETDINYKMLPIKSFMTLNKNLGSVIENKAKEMTVDLYTGGQGRKYISSFHCWKIRQLERIQIIFSPQMSFL
ncbi:hypothetical protein HZS_2635 [Henneguya salminicola]|nr:hypothetical protein HZS_2635 [Henneguya salminicola]